MTNPMNPSRLTAISQKLDHLLGQLQSYWSAYWLLRWIVTTLLGWTLGLLLMALLIAWLGVMGVPLGMAVAGLCIGIGQRMARALPGMGRRWPWWTVAGIFVGSLVIVPLLLIVLINRWVAWLLMGALFGGLLGGLQVLGFRKAQDTTIVMWVLANVFGGVLCAPLTLGTMGYLPLLCTPGLPLFALVTAVAIHWLRKRLPDKPTLRENTQ